MAIKRKSQIDDKDLSDDISKILADQLDALKNQLMQTTYSALLLNSDLDIEGWYKNQVINKDGLIKQIKGVSRVEAKRILTSLTNGLGMLDLSSGQVKGIKKEVNTELENLSKAIIHSYNSNLIEIVSQTVLKNGVTDSLFDIIQDKITKTNDYGLVTYEGGRKVRWENYMEMKLRTDIQNDIAKNMVKAGLENGVVFYICSYHGDCAPDHVDYQGKIYYDKNWKSNIQDVDLRQEIQEYINRHSLMSIQKVMKEPVYLTSRPNCRHYFQYISIDEVLAINNENELDNKRQELDLNSKGKYKPEKYEALKEQRYNERRIRKIKSEIEVQNKIIDNLPNDATIGITNQQQHRLFLLKKELRKEQKKQRELMKNNPGALQRNYNREAYNRMISDMGNKALKNNELDGTIINEYNVAIEKIKNDIPTQKKIREEVVERFKDGRYKNAIADIQDRHIKGTTMHSESLTKGQMKSILEVKPESLVKYIGKGTTRKCKDGQIIETVIADKKIGLYFSEKLDEPIETNVFEIRFSKSGYHFIPVHPKKGKG